MVGPRPASVAYREPLRDVSGVLKLIDHGDRMVLYRDVTVAAPVEEELIAARRNFPVRASASIFAEGDR